MSFTAKKTRSAAGLEQGGLSFQFSAHFSQRAALLDALANLQTLFDKHGN